MFSGSITSLITPMSDGEIDLDAFGDLVAMQIDQGCHGLLVGGFAGEHAALTMAETAALVQRTVAISVGQTPVMTGVVAGPLADTLAACAARVQAGADAIFLSFPSFLGATESGLIEYVRIVHDEIPCPLLFSGLPGDFSEESFQDIGAMAHLAGLVFTHTDSDRMDIARNHINRPFALLAETEDRAAAFLAQGAHGCISAAACVAPALYTEFHEAWRGEDIDAFETLRDRMAPLARALTLEHSGACAKYALQRLGLCEDDVRPPLSSASDATRAKIDAALIQAGLVSASSRQQAA